jgi:hypothetical protein
MENGTAVHPQVRAWLERSVVQPYISDSSSTVGVHQVSVSYPMREDVKRKTLPFSLQGGGCLTCIQP